ncbi:type II toxin-antitoxin system VapC family toxin [Marihabitans asiaticum]|uniref:PIN domain-containing protein n=1 Tax=Marihabitans asiaticum TaxID=415218 RepID=A0A560WH68_9MICO|nr:PIN domain-containing protein [Marihabitans asiaticum]TWD16844.1 PIN domain-containing protein [Marihabitans asiaticum]
MSVEGGQEFHFHRLRRTDPETAVRQFDLVDDLVTWHPFDVEVLHLARDLAAQNGVRGRDAVHAATALRAGFADIVSRDPDFDGIPGLTRLDPTDGLA